MLALFLHQEYITSGEVAQALSLSNRMARVLLAEWVEEGWLTIADPSRKARRYQPGEGWRACLASTTEAAGVTG